MRREVAFLDSLQGRGIRPGLGRMRAFLRAVGNPQRSTPTIIVAGTNGKGSTASTIASILTASGYRTAMYSSPHLVSLLERWRIDGQNVAEDRFREAVQWLREALKQTRIELTYFEALTALSFRIFEQEQCEATVLEVGMGGRLDATNVTRPVAAVITPIGFDHTEYLGNTLRKIAREKAAVIHRGGVALTSNRDRDALDVIRRRCADVGVPLRVSWRGVTIAEPQVRIDGLRFSLQTRRARYALRSSLTGRHQIDNLTLAVATAEELSATFDRITTRSIERGVREARWRGRLERFVVGGRNVIVDGAHNPHAAAPLAEFVAARTRGPRTLVFGAMRDKDYTPIVDALAPWFDRVVTTRPDPARGEDSKRLLEVFRARGVDGVARRRPTDAIRAALQSADGDVVVAGSLYLAGDAIRLLDQLR